ncbi:hypothetical protein PAESOLCIP111_01478 [Paenibacillus solanacearum]|uniref:Extracellular solute-binding protein n=1 Tax=Paenibacillus solanacearum TaxID=2048548 RepID=A0A916NNC7_9BACL|nr:ABC transporter substrate-binding protein [Paenibacillus solanacearum]CAG7612081.1 hypothetical protein PAESOLCIP111_01478 [Paenibacillus solanacearum]
MNGKKAYRYTVSLMLVTTLLITGCSTQNTPSKSGEGSNVKKDPVELVVYFPFPADWPEEDFFKTFGEPIQKKFPHITIKFINSGKTQELITSGQTIDILFASIGASQAHLLDLGLESDISPEIKKFNYDLNRLEPTMVDAARKMADGKGIYGLPVYVPPSAIYYNKDLFDKFGVPYPKDDMTWDELFELSKKMTRNDGGTQYYGLASSYGHLATMNQMSIPLVGPDKTATFDKDDRWKTFVDNLIRFYRLPGFEVFKTGDLSESAERNRFFKNRNIAMFIATTALHNEKEVQDMNFDIASFPVYKDKPQAGPQPYPINFYITSQSQKRDDAFEVIAYLTSEEFQMKPIKEGKLLTALANKTIRAQFGTESSLYKGKNVKALQPNNYSPLGAYSKYTSTASGEINTGLRDAIVNKKDTNTLLREAAERANKKIQELETAAAAKK